MNYIYKYILGALFLIGIGTLNAQKFQDITSTKKLEKELKEVSNNLKTISADFVQKKHLEVLDVVVESKGRFLFKSPKQLRWEYITPYQYLVLMNKGKLKIIQGKNVQEFDVNGNDSFKEINDLIVNSITGDLFASKRFIIKTKESTEQYKLLLTPRDKNISQVLYAIEILINKKDKTVEELLMHENENDFTSIKFFNKIINENISDSHFSLP